MDRRRFLQCLAIAAVTPVAAVSRSVAEYRLGRLQSDANQLLDLPDGFEYRIVSRAGDEMSDGLVVPAAHDGMAAFPAKDGRVILVCNHELRPTDAKDSAFVDSFATLPESVKSNFYDQGHGDTPGAGGTTTTIYNLRTGKTEQQHLSLAGTEINCAGGPTPWGSWLSCEECFEDAGTRVNWRGAATREQRHGYVFEVPANETGLVRPQPIKAMGRFEHEAAAVHEASGVIYMTEDRHHGLFYRYISKVADRLLDGGRLQALAIVDRPSQRTHNWSAGRDIAVGDAMATRWIDLVNVDPDENVLRLEGAMQGAASFARGEGMCTAGHDIVFACSYGGPHRLGQVFAYRPDAREGQETRGAPAGNLTLIAEARPDSLLHRADNIMMAPWGDLIVCEDAPGHCGVVGIRPDGSQYQLAYNAYSTSELAGACFSPDGRTMFLNIQYPGVTLAITGPFPS